MAHSTNSEFAIDKRSRNPLASSVRPDREMMKMAAPSVPAGDNRADDPSSGCRNEQMPVECLDSLTISSRWSVMLGE